MKRNIKIYTTAILFAMSFLVISCNNSKNKETVKYQCPMKCEGEKTYDKAGSCPVCEMDLEVLEESSKANASDTAQ